MANLQSYVFNTMKKNTDIKKRHQAIVKDLISITNSLEKLQEDPIFIDGIHGEQELSLDQTLELLKGIKEQFLPLKVAPAFSPVHEAEEIDVS
tara:strand:- start:347 stop:625 length:279 start_codon:yes stop_codon:yes gene_type:complete